MTRKTPSSKSIDLHVGQRIRFFRVQKGWSQHELSKQLNISYQQLHKYENGMNSASASRMADIATALKVCVPDLFEGFESNSDDASPALKQYNKEQLLLIKYLSKINDPSKRSALASLLRSLTLESQH